MRIFFLLFCMVLFGPIIRAQNVGIGTAPSNFQLDINGRARLRAVNGNAQLPGIYFQHPTSASHAIMGMQTNDILGFSGPGAGWQFGMNVNTGHIGFGTSSPSASLDINGSFRWRNNQAQANAVLMSKDNDGNATWQRPVAFGVSGTPELSDLTFSTPNTWNKLAFGAIADYNLGIAWQPVNNFFQAPVKGVYRFSLHLQHKIEELGSQVRFIRSRGGANFVVATQEFIGFSHESHRVVNGTPLDLHLDLLMEPQDQLWVELNPGFVYPAYILGAKRYYSFSGRLLFLQ
jgi:hypothetical protein